MKIKCKKCNLNYHEDRWAVCYRCSGKEDTKVCLNGCERHKNNPQPALCLDCMEVKKIYFKK